MAAPALVSKRARQAFCVNGPFSLRRRLIWAVEKWDGAYPTISQMWRRNWENLTPFFGYPADIRKVIYTTNAIESLNMSLRKVIKTRGSFPNPDAAMKLLFLALEHIAKKWTMPVQNWKAALQRFCWEKRAGITGGPASIRSDP